MEYYISQKPISLNILIAFPCNTLGIYGECKLSRNNNYSIIVSEKWDEVEYGLIMKAFIAISTLQCKINISLINIISEPIYGNSSDIWELISNNDLTYT